MERTAECICGGRQTDRQAGRQYCEGGLTVALTDLACAVELAGGHPQ